MQTGLHSQFGSGPFDVGMQVGRWGGISGMPVSVHRSCLQACAAGQFSAEQPGCDGYRGVGWSGHPVCSCTIKMLMLFLFLSAVSARYILIYLVVWFLLCSMQSGKRPNICNLCSD